MRLNRGGRRYAGAMKLKPILLLAAGVGFLAVSRSLELQGDLAPFAESGVSSERLIWHGGALILLLCALASFIAAFFALRKARKPPSNPPAG
jgi:hypothetical protein